MLTDKKGIITLALFILFVIGGFVGQGVWAALVPVCLLFLLKAWNNEKFPKFSDADFLVLAVCLAEILACLFSVWFPNSVKALAPVILVTFFWLFFRTVSNSGNHFRYVVTGGSIFAMLLSLITIVTFISFKKDFSVYEVSSLTDFKQQFRPCGLTVNDWVAFLLCLLPYPSIAACRSENRPKRIFHVLSSALLTSSIILSLSRGAYVALAVFYMIAIILVAVFRNKAKGRHLAVLCFSAFIGILLVIPARTDVLTTCAIHKTTSQKLSTEGRLSFLDNAINIWKEKPVTGVGQGNFNIVYDGNVTDRKASRTRATNAYALILVERGAAGLLAWLALALTVLISGIKKTRKHPSTAFFVAGFCAFCVRGLFFSSLFKYRALLMLMMLLTFNMVQEYGDDDIKE